MRGVKKLAVAVMAAILAITPVTYNVQAATTTLAAQETSFTQAEGTMIQYSNHVTAAQAQEAVAAYNMLPDVVKQLLVNKGVYIYLCNTDEEKYLPVDTSTTNVGNAGFTRTAFKKKNGKYKISSEFVVIRGNQATANGQTIKVALLHEVGHVIDARSCDDGANFQISDSTDYQIYAKKYFNLMKNYAYNVQNVDLPAESCSGYRGEHYATAFAACVMDGNYVARNAPDLYNFVMTCAATAVSKDA